MEIEGDAAALAAFLKELRQTPPPLARVQSIETREIRVTGDRAFVVRASAQEGRRSVLIAPDYATCEDCLRELRDPSDRRHRYPFINCSHCGPRYTIIRDVPYDRSRTTMAGFAMCAACRAEYESPSSRRFHAEATCCPTCGPRLELTDATGKAAPCADPVAAAIARLEAGEIVAVKGLGGFHLACDAANADAVQRLRTRKNRDCKPFAVMARDMVAIRRLCDVALDDVAALTGSERPIVLMRKRAGHGLAESVAPRSACFGVMLPYTPLHHLLMDGSFRALVMTSGNVSDEPIVFTNEDALERLGPFADCFLLHDRPIHVRTDDSVARVLAGKRVFLRRSRGYAPFPVDLPVDTQNVSILATGPDMSNTICLTRDNRVFLSHHIGDLRNVAAYESFLQAIGHLENLLDVRPDRIACDLHPDYMSTRYARAAGLPVVPVQHHHAHAASVLAEAGRCETVLGVIFDGLGWGADGTLWGGEFLVADLAGFERIGHLAPLPQPGGDAAARHPERMAYAYLRAAFGADAALVARILMPAFAEKTMKMVGHLLEAKRHCPLTSSMGRLFDSAGALLGICAHNSYHAQAPMELEAAAFEAEHEQGSYGARILTDASGRLLIQGSDIVRGLAEDFMSGTPACVCAARFHQSIAHVSADMCERVRERTGVSVVALSGGVFANAFLLGRLAPMLEERGFEVLRNVAVPAGDGGISLGQAAVAARRLSCA